MNNIIYYQDNRENYFTVPTFKTIILLLILLCGVSGAAWGQSTTWDGTEYSFAENKFAEEGLAADGHDGKSWEKAYVITTAKQLAYFAWIVKNNKTGRANNYYWKLGADIDLGGHNWVFGGDASGAFQGHFDGQNHTISNLKLDVNTNSNYGLLTTIQGVNSTTQLAEVKNLNINGVTFTSASSRNNDTRWGALTGTAKQANISNVKISNVTFTFNNTIAGNSRVGGAIGYLDTATSLNDVDVTGVTANFGNTTTSLYFGGIVGQTGGTANTSYMTGCDAKTIKVIHSSNVTGTTHMGGLVGNANTSLKTITNNTVSGVGGQNDGKGFDVSVTGSTVNFYAGGLIGYTIGDRHEVEGNRVENVCITNTGTINGGRLGGFIGYVESNGTTDKILVKNNTATTINITVGGNTVGTPYLGGFIGQAKGKASPNNRTLIEGNTVTSPSVTMNGVVGHGFYMGGFLGIADAHANIFNNKVVTPRLSITKDINAATYVGGAIGCQANYTTIDGMTVSGGSISGPTSDDKQVKNNTNFFVGGFLGMQNSSGTTNYQPNVFKNIAVTGIDINLGHYVPATTITNNKFGVGGIAGTVNTPNQDALGNRGMPENIIFKGGKIYAPYATTSPTVSNFNASNPGQNTGTPDNVVTVDAIEKAKTKTWYYSDYKLGLNDAVVNNTDGYGTTPAKDKFRKNYTTPPVPEDGINYLTVNGSTFQKQNRYLDGERDSKTVLWWSRADGYNANGLAATLFNEFEQPVYPHQAGGTTGTATDFPFYWYFFQGVMNANYVAPANADKIIAGITANYTEAQKAKPLTLTVSNDNENKRGFEPRTITVTPSAAVSSYEWYVDGVKQSATGTSISVTPDWKNGKGIVVNALDGSSNVVATASYALPFGVLKTRNGDAVRSDITKRGTQDNPYLIDCESALRQLSYLSTYTKSLYFEGLDKLSTDAKNPHHSNMHFNRAYYELTTDINLGGREFTPVSHSGYSADGTWGTNHQDYVFQGHFDGKGHKISNFNIPWRAGTINGGNYSAYHGLFGALGNITATTKWQDAEESNTVVKNLVIENATFTHDTGNTSFYYPNTTTGNYCMIGVLAGIVSSNTTVQNIEIRNSSIIDTGSSEYSLATKGLYVGGAIGSIQYGIGNSSKTQTDLIPENTKIEHIAAQVDITLTYPAFADVTKGAQVGQFNVGGIIGRFIASNTTQQLAQGIMPKYTFYSGRINAPKAWISPVLASLRYSASNDFAYYSKMWEGNNNAAGTQVNIEGAQFYNFYIGTESTPVNLITNVHPANTCAWGARTFVYHTDASENAKSYDARKYQGVNYNATYIDSNQQSLQVLNTNTTDGFNWKWSDAGFPQLTKAPYIGAYLTRGTDTDINTFTANIEGTTATSYSWKASFDGTTWHDLDAVTSTYAAPVSLKPKYIAAFVNGTYRTMPMIVDPADVSVFNPNITAADAAGGQIFTANLNNTIAIDHLTPAYQWYKSDNKTQWDGATTNSLTLTTQQYNESKNMVWCTINITELGEIVGTYSISYGATVVYIDGTNGQNGTDGHDGSTPEKAVLTIDYANGLLKTPANGGTVDNNVIVVIGTLNPSTVFKSKGSNPATLTGKWDGVDHKAIIKIQEDKVNGNEHDPNYGYDPARVGHNCYVLADTKFENLTFQATSNTAGNNFIECHGNDVWFGKGLKMDNFNNLAVDHGNLADDSQIVPELTIVLTATNLPEAGIRKYTENRTKPQVVTFESGNYGRIMGGRFTNGYFAHANNNVHTIIGSAANPVWAIVNVNIDKESPKTYTCDINCIIAGLTDGTMYGDYEINLHGGNVRYIVGANQGNAIKNGGSGTRPSYTPVGGTPKDWGQWPNSSYFGRTIINVDQLKDKNGVDLYAPIIVKNLYAGGLGRNVNGGDETTRSIVDMYLYGHTEVNVKSGQVLGNVYAGGAGGVIGLNPWDAHVPYASSDADAAANAIYKGVQYGDNRTDFGNWSSKVFGTSPLADVTLRNPDGNGGYVIEQLNLANSTTTVNITGGTIGGNVYGGGAGYVSNLPYEYTMQGVGSVFGTTYVNISGNPTISGNVYGGSMGDTKYYGKKNTYGQTINHIAETNGTINLYITGTEDKCPTILGNIYGAGQGIASVGGEDYARIATTGNATLGDQYKTEINLTIDLPEIEAHKFAGKVYGGGQMGMVDGNIEVNIKHGLYGGEIFGGGLGENGHPDKAKVNGSTIVNISGGKLDSNVYGGGDMGLVSAIANVNIDGGELRGSVFGGGNKAAVGTAYSGGERTDWAAVNGTFVVLNNKNASVYGDIFGGGNLSAVNGDTHVNLYAGNFGGNIFGGGNGLLDGGGAVQVSADVTGNTFIYIAHDEGGQNQATKKDNFSINVIWDKKWSHSSKSFKTWQSDPTDFYDGHKFLDNHNIYGGGNLACKVGTYTSDAINVATKPADGTGKATVQVLKGMTPVDLLRTAEWKDSYNDNKNPHFYVFGGGFGEKTKVGSTDVTVDVEGEYGEYTAEVDDETEQMAKGSRGAVVPGINVNVFDNSKGIPNFTVLGVLGGGYAGVVANNAKVTVDGKTFLHRVYGGGFGDPNSTANNTTGQVGGDADVIVNGAHTYGDVFGGGAGVVSTTVDLDNVARVLGKTSVTVADDANIYGKVYGGGDMACVGVAVTADGYTKTSGNYTSKPSSISTRQSDASWIYAHDNHQSFVNILGGNIFGEVYGGGMGVKKAMAHDYTKVGRIEGNTLVHIANAVLADNGQSWVTVPESNTDAIVPYVWNRIYGGCAYGIVDGNTMVHTEGGMLGLNIFGGGYGDMHIDDDQTDSGSGASTASSTLDQVLGKLDNTGTTTFANILGNTKVQIDGGSWIWNRKADTNGNITSWENASKKIVDGLDGFKALVMKIQSAETVEDLKKIEEIKHIDPNFFKIATKQFAKNHNIFGGGNRACFVGTYPATVPGASASGDAQPDANTGTAEVIINHSPITKIDDGKGNMIDMIDVTTVSGLCWYLGINNISHPQFSVFGAGYGANTKVGNTIVSAQPGVQLDSNGDLPDVVKGKYINEESDLLAYYDYDLKIAESWQNVSLADKKQYYGLANESNEGNTFMRYRSSQLAWSSGAPNFTFMDIHGGGFSGYVVNNVSVTTDCQLNARNIFGAGLGYKPYGAIAGQAAADAFTFGQVGGKSEVFVKSGIISLNVYGGGAGVESVDKDGDGSIDFDFPNIARVKKTTNVDIYGETIKIVDTGGFVPALKDKRLERTIIFGSIYGGGDVANVGTTANDTETKYVANNVDSPADGEMRINDETFTSTVNVRGGSIQSQVYAGGNGRTANRCSVTGSPTDYGYKKLGAVYGNTRLIVDAADKTYPYNNTTPNPGVSPHIWNRIYGGCENGTVYGNTLVEVNNGSLGHNVFGGGFGDDGTNFGHSTGDDDPTAHDLDMRGRATPVITSADVTGNTNIIVNDGEMELTSFWHPDSRIWEPATIKGATTYSPQYDPEMRKFKINHNIFGGGNAACVVKGNTYVTMNKGMLKTTTNTLPGVTQTNFFASNEWKEVYQKTGSPHFAVFGGGYGEQTVIGGTTNIAIAMKGEKLTSEFVPGLGHLYFGSQQSVMDVVGGGYSGKVVGDANVNVSGTTYARRVFGGGFYNSVSSTYVNITSVDCDDVFGGGLMGDVINSTNVNVGTEETGDHNNKDIWIHGSIYGGNDVSGYINMNDEVRADGFFAENNVDGGTKINIFGGKIDGNVYGAGNGDYLYALDREGHTTVTVNEHYFLDPDDANSQQFDLVYTVPMRETMPSYKSASDAAKIVNINSYRPLTNRVSLNIHGSDAGDKVIINGDVYGGGNSATVQKVYKDDGAEMVGDVNINIGNYVSIGRVFMGCNGDKLFTASEDNAFLSDFQKLNNLTLDSEIDWATDPSNHGISTLYLPTENEQRPIIYPHLLDLYFQPVEMNIQANLKWNNTDDGASLTDCTIGTFCCGGNRGNMNVYPETTGAKEGNVLDYLFPEGLTITDKIIGGCNNANYVWFNSEKNTKISHEGGYLLGEGHTTYPFIKLTVKNKFTPAVVNSAYKGGNVFGGCFETGTVRGDITVDLKSDMLYGKEKAKLDKSNELLTSDPDYATLNVYGAGYGMESYVYGNTNILFGQGVACTAPTETDGKFDPNGPVVADKKTTGTSANFVYGGGQQGNVIGVTNVDVLNGHIYKSVTGGSYSGYVYGSTQIKVGYPTTYTLKSGQAGRYLLKRADENNLQVVNTDASGNTTPTIKQYINLIPGDVITAAVYDAIYAKYNGDGVAATDISSSKGTYFTETVTAPASPLTWDNINIYIDEACYGGGYSLAQGSSVMANNITVLKYTDDYNINNTYRSGALADLTGGNHKGTTAGFGGNTMMLIGDNVSGTRDHITISHQEMKPITLPPGTDLFGYYYKETAAKGGNYRYIYQSGTYTYGGTMPEGADGTTVYEYDGEGGIFGDGHLSYAEGFRAADLTGYGYADYTPNSAKIVNTFQRMDILRLKDNCLVLLGARDYATNATNKTPYSISRVGEIQMRSSIDDKNNLPSETSTIADKITYNKRYRNYMGLSNNIHYVGAIQSDVNFNDATNYPWHEANGTKSTKSYETVKQEYIDGYYNEGANKGNVSIFQKRNDGTAKNMIGIASGYALKIQNVYETIENNKVKDNLYYGPIYGVVQMRLIDVRQDEGGGYVYADNVHKRTSANTKTGDEDFLETTGNFVFPYSELAGQYIVDDCFPKGYDKSKATVADDGHHIGDATEDIHYWYVTGFNYYYNVHITGFTYNSTTNMLSFNSDNSDGLTVLAGMKEGQTPTIYSWKMRSGHPTDDSYSCDLETRNYDISATDNSGNKLTSDSNHAYNLYISGSNNTTYDQTGVYYSLPMNTTLSNKSMTGTLPEPTGGDAKISFCLTDKADNSSSEYYNQHMKEPCLATLVLRAPYIKEKGGVQQNGYVGIQYYYTRSGEGTNESPYVYTVVPSNTTSLTAGTTYYYYDSSVDAYTELDLGKMYVKNGDDYAPVSRENMSINGTTSYYYMTPRWYTYTIYLTIDYVQGPNITGHINVENCALPGEMVRVNKKNVKIESDESFAADGYYWRIGKRVKDTNHNWTFEDTTPWTKATATDNSAAGYDTYMQTELSGTGKGFFQGANYDKTNDYLDIPAYYYMNGYGIQLGVSMTGLDQIFPVAMQDEDQFVVHNYHRMHPNGSSNVNLHLTEAVARAKAESDVTGGLAEPRIYLSNTDDLRSFVAFLDSVGTGKQIINGEETTTGIVVGDKEYVKLCARKATSDDVTAGKATSEGQWIPNLCEVPRYGEYAQFTVQNDMEIPAGYDVSMYGRPIILKGKVHGEGHVITGLGANKALITENRGHIHNLGMASGKMAASGCTNGGNYHCCFEYNDGTSEKKVYRMNGECVTTYTADDFRYGKVAYDLNQYYLEARKVLAGSEDGCGAASHLHTALTDGGTAESTKAALQYIFDYWANGDYQYARRSDNRTSEITGVTYLRTGTYDDPNYGSNLTRHDRLHTIDKPRAQGYVAEHAATEADVTAGKAKTIGESVLESRTGDYLPLFNSAYHTESLFSGDSSPELINDYIYWGQNLQQIADDYPSTIESLQISAMTNRVYRAAGYYGSTAVDGYYYNAYYDNGKEMGTYVHNPSTTAIDFTCQADNETTGLSAYALGYVTANAGTGSAAGSKMYYPPVADNAEKYVSFDVMNDAVTQNLLVYTDANDIENAYDVFDAVNYNKNIAYAELLKEANIEGHHVVNGNDGFQAKYLHLVERTADGINSEGASCVNNNFCAPLAFTVTDRAWYTRKPAYYATDANNAWEGICLPFTVQKAVASINGEITHFYGTPSSDETADPATNYHTLHHEYWLRGLTAVGDATGAQAGKKVGTFKRPGSGDLFNQTTGAVSYYFKNTFFPDTYKKNYTGSIVQNDWYSKEHTYDDYLPLTADVPYIVSFPGNRYYEFDLSSEFYRRTHAGAAAQTVTFNAYGDDAVVAIAVDYAVKTAADGYSHNGTYMEMTSDGVLGMDATGVMFDKDYTTVMPFRTYMHVEAASSAKSRAATVWIGGDATGIENIIEGDEPGFAEETADGDYVRVYSAGKQRIGVESTYATTLKIYTSSGQLYRLLDVRPGTMTYSGFQPGLYVAGKRKLMVK